MRPLILWTLAGAAALVALGLTARRVLSDRRAAELEAALFATSNPLLIFAEADLDGLPEPVQRYLRQAIAPGTPLAPACRLWMDGAMTPAPGAPSTDLKAVETLAPRRGFVWTAKARMKGLPVHVRDHYYRNEGGVGVALLGVLPLASGSGPGVTRSSRGRLVAEGVWCPTALLHPDVVWEAVDDDRARYTISVDGEFIAVTLRLAPEGALQEVTLERWGDADGEPWRLLPYGFRVGEVRTFEGITIPTRLTGGWHYGTDRFDPATAATFTVQRATFAR